MAKKGKHQFHCQKCGYGCVIYRKGKAHRVLVCPVCGVLATNPFSLGGLLGGAATGAGIGSVVPLVGTTAGAIAGGAIGGFSKSGSSKKPACIEGHVEHHYAKHDGFDKIKLALER